MNKYEILKQEYAVKSITTDETEAVAQVMFKCDFTYDI